jgi:hypothetical protein
MRSVSLIDVASLNEAFRKIPVGSNLLHYLAQPKTSMSADKDRLFAEKFYVCLYERVAKVTDFLQERYGSGELCYVPQDAGVVHKKIMVITNNNRAYELAVKIDPTVQDLEEFAKLDPCWSLLFPVKAYLHHHFSVAKDYRGMLPFGGGVIEAVNKIWNRTMKGSPSFQDHVRLMAMTNEIADKHGMTTIAVNDLLYLEGMQIKTA